MIEYSYVFIALLIIVSLIDLYAKKIPSALLTAILFVTCVLNGSNAFLGISAGILAWLLHDLDFYEGLGDVKVVMAMGFMMPNLISLLALSVIIVGLGLFWKLFMVYVAKEKGSVAFIPVFLFSYITIHILNVRGLI